MAPLHVAFSRCVSQMLESLPSQGSRLQKGFEEDRERYRDVTDLGADLSMSLHRKAELFQEMFPEGFSEILESFREAFPSVEQLRVVRFNLFQARPKYDPSRSDVGVGRFLYAITLVLREAGVANWVPFHEMSSGMQRYLSFLIHLSFAPRGTVVLIDELESSLGLNCLPAATRFLLGRAPDLQLILTSHHPYIIEQIPPSHWKIVTRKGSHVRVLDAAKISALEEDRSHLDRSTRLINLPEYEQGIQG